MNNLEVVLLKLKPYRMNFSVSYLSLTVSTVGTS